ncbi:MAG: hypothetical protein M3321_10085 [Actinomycetota bacterium]|nr:hypothetical protein [Actinomycetota bacterium]
MPIEIPELGDAYHETWAALAELARASPAPWTLIGAQMVALHCWRRGLEPLRATRDADLLADARAVSTAAADLSRTLIDLDFEFRRPSSSGQGFTFSRGEVVIDVLAPDGLGRRTPLKTIGGSRTVQVPGGTQALRRTRPLAIRSRDVEAELPVPDLLGALLVTVRAIEVDDAPADKKQDAALLLAAVDDPEPLVRDLAATERRWLRRHPYLGDPDEPLWDGIDGAVVGASVFLRLAVVGPLDAS